MTAKTKHTIAVSFWSFAIVLLTILTVMNYVKDGTLRGIDIFVIALGAYQLLRLFTWGVQEKEQHDDELHTHIKARSFRISYPILLISAIVIYFFFAERDNYPLVAMIAILFITKPLLEFMYARKFQ